MHNSHELSRVLEIFQAGGMTISRMRECLDVWLLGADFSHATTRQDVFKEIERVFDDYREAKKWNEHSLPWYSADGMIWDASGDAIVDIHSSTGQPYFDDDVVRTILTAVNLHQKPSE